jgi:hypothetical protein
VVADRDAEAAFRSPAVPAPAAPTTALNGHAVPDVHPSGQGRQFPTSAVLPLYMVDAGQHAVREAVKDTERPNEEPGSQSDDHHVWMVHQRNVTWLHIPPNRIRKC